MVPFLLVVLACRDRAVPDPTNLATHLLMGSAAAWNRGDVAAFVGDYAEDSTTTFVSGGHAQHGFEWIRRNYQPRFAPGATRDSLRFEEVEARALGQHYLLATASYVLFRGDAVTSSGPFTLILRRTNGHVEDHS